ncbi:MAG: serine/threonine protein kinase [Deltaproteobacteria bacterium]|nr:serine/threonine protein kinase [Deltaproteobacteria bacterium]
MATAHAPDELQDVAAAQLGVVAIQFAVVLVAGWVAIKATVGGADFFAGDVGALVARGALGNLGDLITLITVGLCVGLFLRTRREVSGFPVLTGAAVLHVGAALGVACTELWGPWPPDLLPRGVTYASVWIAIFPLVMPTTFRRSVITSFLAAAMIPVGLALSVLLGPNEWPTTGVAAALVVPTFIIAALAIFPGSTLHRLREEAALARSIGSYTLTEKLGQGGMGEVWRASHQLLARPAAVKLVRQENLGTEEEAEAALTRFEREAQATATLVSPHTIQLFDFGRTREGDFYYVMELLDGVDLQALVTEHGPLPPERVVWLLEQACHSLEEAHRRGLVHRDIKPANLFACRYGLDADFVKVLDFGLVRRDQGAQDDVQLTAVGTVTGTAAYMAPERVDGLAGGAPVDIYALGCVAYWLLTGGLVFEADSAMKQLVMHARDTPDPPSRRSEFEVPDDLDALILRCLAKDPQERPGTAGVLRDELLALALPRPWTGERATRWWNRVFPPSNT